MAAGATLESVADAWAGPQQASGGVDAAGAMGVTSCWLTGKSFRVKRRLKTLKPL
jgi:hypothetical protein